MIHADFKRKLLGQMIRSHADPAELGKVRRPDVGITGDCQVVIEALVAALAGKGGAAAQPDRSEWRSAISGSPRPARDRP